MQLKPIDPMYKEVSELIAAAIKKAFNEESDILDLYNALTTPPNPEMGDLCFGTFALAKKLKLAPPKIAQSLMENLAASTWIDKIQLQGPYMNFHINLEKLASTYGQKVYDGSLFKLQIADDLPVSMVEFSQPNTHKEMHVGHMRNLCLGDALIKLLRYTGHHVIACTFPGDVGTHVAKCLWYMKNHNREEIPSQRKGAWLGTLYTKGNNLLEQQKDDPEKFEANKAQLTQILKELHAKKGDYYQLWKETREWSIDLMKSVYDWADVQFDQWFWESDVDEASVQLVKEYYDKGLFVKDQGAIGIDLSSDKLGFCLLLKSDGTGLYATKDVELARRKFNDFDVEKNIYVVDNRQARHFKQVFKVLEKMGFPHADDCFHLQYEMVELTDGAMSSRKGNIVAIQDLIDQMTQMIKEKYLNRYQTDWDQAEIDETASKIASGAIKYGMTRIDNNKKIVFNMDEWLKLDGESGPYIQYVYARINSMIKKLGGAPESIQASVFKHPLEKALWMQIASFNSAMTKAALEYKTALVCSYLYELSKSFNSFYAECSVANAESEELKKARLYLCSCVATTLEKGLSLLGIKAPQRM